MDEKRELVTAPTLEPITTAEGKAQLRVDFSDDDDLIDALITACRDVAERTARRAFLTQTWDLFLDAFPAENRIDLPLPPLQSVSGVYYTPDGAAEATFAASNYSVDTYGTPGGIVLNSDAAWPGDSLKVVNGVRIRFVAGYGDAADDVPQRYRAAIKLLLGHLYENRENVVIGQGITISEMPQGALWLLGFDRNFRFV